MIQVLLFSVLSFLSALGAIYVTFFPVFGDVSYILAGLFSVLSFLSLYTALELI